MKMNFQFNTGADSIATISHAGENLYWNIGRFRKVDNREPIDSNETAEENAIRHADDPGGLTDHINRYWAYQPEADQAAIFEVYKKILETMEEIYVPQYLISSLTPLVTKLLNLHPLSNIKHWLAFYGDVISPPDIMEVFTVPDSKPTFPEKTYIRSEYNELIAMALILRTMIPIWREFIRRTETETGNYHKEYFAYYLISQSVLINSAPMRKLAIYVEKNIKSEQITDAAKLTGFGEENYAEWLLATILIRRVCVGDISGKRDGSHLVINIYNYISHQYRQPGGSSFGMVVRKKEFESNQKATDNSASRLEGYKLMEDVSIGDIAIPEFYLENVIANARVLYPNIDENLLMCFIESSKFLHGVELHKAAVVLTQWVCKPIISPRVLGRVVKTSVVDTMPIAQTILWQEGQKVLAALISATRAKGETGGNLYPAERLTPETIELINRYYPYGRITATRSKAKPVNNVIKTIDQMALLLDQHPWKLNIPQALIKELGKGVRGSIYDCPPSIKPMLAKLVIWHNERPQIANPIAFTK